MLDLIVSVHAGKVAVLEKGIEDFVTNADLVAQKIFTNNITKIFPTLQVIGEESEEEYSAIKTELKIPEIKDLEKNIQLFADKLGLSYPTNEVTLPIQDCIVWLDPVDGTTEFIKGNKKFVTNLIGLSYKGKPFAGIVGYPFGYSSESYTWFVGSYPEPPVIINKLSGKYEVVPTNSSPIGKKRLLVSNSHFKVETMKLIEKLKPTEVLKVGGCGYKGIEVANGKGDAYAYPNLGVALWDVCAIDAINKCKGNTFTNANNKEISYDPKYLKVEGLICTNNKDLHQEIADIIKQDNKKIC